MELNSTSPIPSPAEPVPAELDILCEHCGYSLIGLTDSSRCPECGKEFDPNDLPLARVPWLYRVRLGKLRAYWRTVWYVLLRPAGFAAELCRPVRISVLDARRFRRWSIRIGTTSVVIPCLALMLTVLGVEFGLTSWPRRSDTIEILSMGTLGLLGIAVSAWFFFVVATDLPTFIWKGLSDSPNELAPIHHYAAAPLALMPLLALAVVGIGVAEFAAMRDLDWATAIGVGIVFVIELGLVCRIATIFMRVATSSSPRKRAGLVAYLIFHWVLIALVSFMGFAAMMMAGYNVLRMFKIVR